jgi:hypothetical protein
MSIVNPQGNEKYWFNGFVFVGLKLQQSTGTEKYWFNGAPIDFLMPRKSAAGFIIMF